MEETRMSNSDYRFMQIVWQHAPVGSGELVRLCAEELGWKKSTTYTEIKRLSEKGFLKNENAVVEPLISMEEAQKRERRFCGTDIFRIPSGISGSVSGREKTVGKRGR